ncbi:hypothetical protein GCM10027594_08430 [Hymenobacter agri]
MDGRIFACRVHAANGHDGTQALHMLPTRPNWGPRLTTVVTDKGYRGRFATHLLTLGIIHQLVTRPPHAALCP